jgi:hypothetical protein
VTLKPIFLNNLSVKTRNILLQINAQVTRQMLKFSAINACIGRGSFGNADYKKKKTIKNLGQLEEAIEISPKRRKKHDREETTEQGRK